MRAALLHEQKEGSSLRKLAKKLAISLATLHGFLRGTTPHPRTAKKLLAWFDALPPDRRHPPPERARIAAWVDLDGLADEDRGRVLGSIEAAIRDLHARRGTTPPERIVWVRERREPPSDEEGGGGDENGDADR